MCCFSKNVGLVAATKIFGRPGKDGRQFIVYSMTIKAVEELAMILPIPTPKASAEDAVKFLNLEKYPKFFDEMASGFPTPKGDFRGPPSFGGGKGIAVVEVGSFIASFVPAVKDFARVDEKFKLPTEIWDKLPQYKDWGFAVFQLKKGEQKIHPMAFDFPRADPKKLFFPTVHIHDGKVHEKAEFDHVLYGQGEKGGSIMGWTESDQPANLFMKSLAEAKEIVNPEAHVYRKILLGKLKNEDILV
jgi:hypothetical protein